MKVYSAIGAIIAWFAVAAQLYLIIVNRVVSIPETIVRFFSYFTILTNILVALSFTAFLLKPGSGWGKFFSRSTVFTAITVYITIVGVVYNLVLRALWKPAGLQLVVDELLHSVIPLLFIVFWWMYAPKNGLKWKAIFPWLIYPFVYIIYILFRGALSGFYPYPFINVNDLGYGKVLLNSGGLMIVFLLFSLLFVLIAKTRSR